MNKFERETAARRGRFVRTSKPNDLISSVAVIMLIGAMTAYSGCKRSGSQPATNSGSTETGGKASEAVAPSAGDDAAPAPAAGGKTIGVTLLTMQHQFYQDLRAGLEEAAAEHGYNVVVNSAEFDPARQADQIDQLIVQKVDAMVVCPCDSKSVGAGILAANEAGIPVFTADIASTSPIGKVTSHVASDNVAGGRAAAKLMVDALGGAGKVAILSHPEVASVTDRVNGFKEAIAAHADIEVVAELSANGKRDKAVRVMEDLLQSHPDLSGVFGINDDSALGALAAIEAAGKVGQIKIVGYDATPEARSRIADGGIYGDVIQHPRQIGKLTVAAIHDFFEGRTPESVIPVEVGTFTGE